MQINQKSMFVRRCWHDRLLPAIVLLLALATRQLAAQSPAQADLPPTTTLPYQLFLPYVVQESELITDAATRGATLGDRVWIDTDGDGMQEPREKGLKGAQLDLVSNCGAGTTVATTTSKANGSYTFKNATPGAYLLRVRLPADYQFTRQDAIANDNKDSDVDAAGNSPCLQLAAKQKITNVDVGVVVATTPLPTATTTPTAAPSATPTPAPGAVLGDRVWLDANRNGVQDIGEKGVSGLLVELFTNCTGSTRVAQATANGNGNYYLSNLATGDYYLRVRPPTGYQFTIMNAIVDDDYDSDLDANGYSWCLHLTAGSTVHNVDIGLVQTGAPTPPSISTPTTTPTATPSATTTSSPTATSTPYPTATSLPTTTGTPVALSVPLVFVSRQIPNQGSVYWTETKGMPGVGPYSRFQVAAPGKLLIRETNGAIRPLIDGSNPTAASLNLIDVNAPAVAYDGRQILFAGLPQGQYSRTAMTNPGAWRIYVINIDGSGLRQITKSDRDHLTLSQFGQVASLFTKYDDTDPVWLPDGRIVFSSTRWPGMGMYGSAHTSNLFVVNADGSDLHRITTEANGADRPAVDPTTGRIVYSRWWRNFRMAANDMSTVPAPAGGFWVKDGLVAANMSDTLGNAPGGPVNLQRNAWHLATVNPDGTDLKQWGFGSNTFLVGEDANFAYGGSFAPDGSFYANFFPMKNGTEAAGFGGIRHFVGGMFGSQRPVIGITSEFGYEYAKTEGGTSFGVYRGVYATEPEVLGNNQLIIAYAEGVNQDYGLYLVNTDGRGLRPLYNLPGMTELRARVVAPRPLPPIIPDQITQRANPLPPTAAGPYDRDGTFTFQALNVYFNAPVDSNIISALPIGAAGTIRLYTGFQRDQQYGSLEQLEWPLLLQELPVNPDGSVTAQSPANLPLFEQIRTGDGSYTVPLTGRGHTELGGAAHVAGLNFGRPGETQRCVGCHAGHSMIPVPANPADALFTNVAPSAAIAYSSIFAPLNLNGEGLIDRQVLKGRITNYWRSAANQNPRGQWVQFSFPVPVTVRTVRLYNPRVGDVAQSTLQVQSATVILYADAAATREVTRQPVGQLAVSGTDVSFAEVRARAVRVVINDVTGTFEGLTVAGLAEVEVIARAEARE